MHNQRRSQTIIFASLPLLLLFQSSSFRIIKYFKKKEKHNTPNVQEVHYRRTSQNHKISNQAISPLSNRCQTTGNLPPCYNMLHANTYTHSLLLLCLSLPSFHWPKYHLAPAASILTASSQTYAKKHPFGDSLQEKPLLYFWNYRSLPQNKRRGMVMAHSTTQPTGVAAQRTWDCHLNTRSCAPTCLIQGRLVKAIPHFLPCQEGSINPTHIPDS